MQDIMYVHIDCTSGESVYAGSRSTPCCGGLAGVSSLEAAGYVLHGFSSVTQPTTYRSSKTHSASEHELAVWRRRSVGVDCLLHVCLRASVSFEYLPINLHVTQFLATVVALLSGV